MIVGVNHVQVNVPTEALELAREFYLGFLGLREISRPTIFTSKGIWMHAGSFEFHIGVEDGVDRSKTRAHVAFEVNDLKNWRQKVESRGWEITDQPLIPGYDRFHFRDPFDNNIELIERIKESHR
jgi:catechol 2,3-dioxygenase-like lactoylglutathione lyase family enzyme